MKQELENSTNQIQKLNNENDDFKRKIKEIQFEKIELEKNRSEKDNQLDIQKLTESEINKLQQSIDILTLEKNNLLQSIAIKHNENIQYYNEIQRLDQLLKLKVEEFEKITSNKSCDNCLEIQKEIENLKDQNKFLKEKSDILTENLLAEQTNKKLLLEEKNELIKQNDTLIKDLERLRQHLIELEESHTQETIEMQNVIDETKVKLAELQKEVSNSSNAYTSAR